MMGITGDKQHQLMFFNLEDYVPKEHFLRLVQKEVDFSFVYEKVQQLYAARGRKSVDPTLLMNVARRVSVWNSV